jgi:hypothetical protein
VYSLAAAAEDQGQVIESNSLKHTHTHTHTHTHSCRRTARTSRRSQTSIATPLLLGEKTAKNAPFHNKKWEQTQPEKEGKKYAPSLKKKREKNTVRTHM